MTADLDYRIVHLTGTRLTPQVVLHRTLQKQDRIKAVAIVIQWDDDTFDADWSQMKVSELCMAVRVLEGKVDRVVFGEDNA